MMRVQLRLGGVSALSLPGELAGWTFLGESTVPSVSDVVCMEGTAGSATHS